tara:strand:- start:426 stop:602 length:177 start_codon:yes stop_codon:yes gene_type:complete
VADGSSPSCPTKTRGIIMELDLSAGVRSFLKNTIFAHPDDIKEEKNKKKTPPKKGKKL